MDIGNYDSIVAVLFSARDRGCEGASHALDLMIELLEDLDGFDLDAVDEGYEYLAQLRDYCYSDERKGRQAARLERARELVARLEEELDEEYAQEASGVEKLVQELTSLTPCDRCGLTASEALDAGKGFSLSLIDGFPVCGECKDAEDDDCEGPYGDGDYGGCEEQNAADAEEELDEDDYMHPNSDEAQNLDKLQAEAEAIADEAQNLANEERHGRTTVADAIQRGKRKVTARESLRRKRRNQKRCEECGTRDDNPTLVNGHRLCDPCKVATL